MESFRELQRRQLHIFRVISMFILALKILPFPLGLACGLGSGKQ